MRLPHTWMHRLVWWWVLYLRPKQACEGDGTLPRAEPSSAHPARSRIALKMLLHLGEVSTAPGDLKGAASPTQFAHGVRRAAHVNSLRKEPDVEQQVRRNERV